MKSVGIVRKIDNLGRLCLPVEIRRLLCLKLNSPMEFYMDGENVVIRKYEPSCVFCGETDNTVKLGISRYARIALKQLLAYTNKFYNRKRDAQSMRCP